jgi:hypothetical protein
VFLLETKMLDGIMVVHRTGCNDDVPGWGESLGTVSFVSERIAIISNGTLTQIWSDDVTATNCQKEMFNGGGLHSNFNADCRSNPNRDRHNKLIGDLFSWCAVHRFQNYLCPYPWRVPTKQDFVNLDIILREGKGSIRWHTSRYRINAPAYWSLSEHSKTMGYGSFLRPSHILHVAHFPGHARKSTGFLLRCIR